MIYSAWFSCTLDYDRPVDGFTGDDVDRYTELIDLGRPFEELEIYVPTIDSSTIQIAVQRDSLITTTPVFVHQGLVTGETPAWGTAAWATTAGTGAYYITAPLGCNQFVRIYTGSNQTADRVFYIRGTRS